MTESQTPFYDSRDLLQIQAGGSLPHWHQDGKVQFVTFRLADSLPQKQVDYLRKLIENFKENNAEPWSDEVRQNFRTLVSRNEEQMLNNGYGSCIFTDSNIRNILADSIWKYDGLKYNVLGYVIMPNHVHLLIHLIGQIKLSQVMQSIKGDSARRINQALNRIGVPVWKRESYDHIVRSYDELKHFRNYIFNNPKFLPSEHFELYL